MAMRTSPARDGAKPHYELLDGLRGVAALAVVWYHVNEGFAFASGSPVVSGFNHGYMAVDFFFILSGFVIGYAYDDRWKGPRRMTAPRFFLRRLARLHPMVVMGAVIGAVSFCVQGCDRWDGGHATLTAVALALACAACLVPAVAGVSSYDVRGNGEMFPLNGPTWSLFFEYIGNAAYALLLRRLPTRALAVLAAALGAALAAFAVTDAAGYGNFGVGWTLDGVNLGGGLLRMLFPFSMGLLMSRAAAPRPVKGAWWICAAALIAVMAVPHISPAGAVSANGIYEAVCIILVFPAIVWLGAGSAATGSLSRACRGLGAISYPLYAVHYPLMYLFYHWMIGSHRLTLADTWPVVAALCCGSLALAWACLKLYDEPLRRRLGKLLAKKERDTCHLGK